MGNLSLAIERGHTGKTVHRLRHDALIVAVRPLGTGL